MQRFIIYFLILFAVGSTLINLLPDALLAKFNVALAWICVEFIQLFDTVVLNDNAIIATYPVNTFSLQVVNGCNALGFSWLLSAAILAFPAKWHYKLIAVLAGFAAVQLLNIIRLVSLFYIGQWFPTYFDLVHENFWPLLFSADVVLLFFAWLWYVNKREPLVTHAI